MDNYTNETPNWEETPVEVEPFETETFESVEVEEEKKSKLFAILCFSFGIAAVVVNCCCAILSIPLGIAAIIFFIISKVKKEEGGAFAIIGLIAAIAGPILYILWLCISPFVLGALGSVGSLGSSSYYY